MLSDEMTKEECREVLAHVSFGRLGCSLDNQPYIVPVCLFYEPDNIYIFSTPEKNIDWMRANPKVCVQVDEVSDQSRWPSVIVNGRYEELPELQYAAQRERTRRLLEKGSPWCLGAFAEQVFKSGDKSIDPLFFRVRIESMTGLRARTGAAPVLVWMSGTDKLRYYFSKGWLDFVGRTLEQESGSGWVKDVHPDDLDRCLQTYISSFDARRSFELEYRLRHHTGQYRWIIDRGVPRYTPDGTFEGYLGGCVDLQSQKEAAEKVQIASDTSRLMKMQDEERRRVARELHDSVGQTLAVLSMSLTQLVDRAEIIAPDLVREGKEIEQLVEQLQREIRTTCYLLHPPLLDECGLASALKWYVQGTAERSGIAITLDIAEDFGRLPRDMELAIFRVAQECLTNIHRHAKSKTASIRVARRNGIVWFEAEDHGKGISSERRAEIESRGAGVGISGIRERLHQFHGEMRIESDGSGTRVFASIPVPNEARSTDLQSLQAA